MCTVFPKFLDIQTFFFYIFDAFKGNLVGYKIFGFSFLEFHIGLLFIEGLGILTTILSDTSIVQQGVVLLKKEVSRGRAPPWPGFAEKTFKSPFWKETFW